jgi:M6 family metalloprotease-like protein
MKNLLFILILIFTGSYIYSQSLEFSCWTDESESIVVPEVQDAINSSSTYNEVVIIAKDYGTSPQLPAWFDEIINGLPVFFSDGTFGNFIFNAEVLKADEILNYAFIFPEPYEPYHYNCWHVHKRENMIDVIQQADAIYDFSLYDYNGDNIVPVHFASIGLKSGGVSGNCLTVTTNDWGNGAYIEVQVVQQTRGSGEEVFRGVYYHESGHTFFNFPDMNHSTDGDYDHYGIGAFDIMCGGGFQGVPSLYNPWFRNVRQWCSPTLIENNITGAVMQDFQTSQNYYLYIPSYTPPNAMTAQKFLISYHTPDNLFYRTWPFIDPLQGKGTLVWHTRENTVGKFDSYSDWRRMKLDVESAHGKFIWNEYSTYVENTGVQNPLIGRDSLEIRKIVLNAQNKWEEIQGPYYGVDDGSASIFYTPDEAGDFAFYSNPNSNYYINSSGETYAQNIVSGFSMKNLRIDNNQAKADFYIDDLTITGSKTLTVGKWYFHNSLNIAGTLTILPGTEIQFHNGASLIVNGTLQAQGTFQEQITLDFVDGQSNGINVRNGGTVNLDYCQIKNAATGISTFHAANTIIVNHCTFENITGNGISVGANNQKLEVYNSTFDDCGSYCINIFGSMATTPKIYLNHFQNTAYGILASSINCVQINWNSFSTSQIGVSIIQIPDAHILGNYFFTTQSLNSGIFFDNSNGFIRENFINGYKRAITLANSSPKIGENEIINNKVNGIYVSSGSVPDLRLFLGLSQTPGCPQYYYALAGCNEISDNGGYTQHPMEVGDDGSEIYLSKSFILLENGNNKIVDDREEVPPLYHTLLLMNGTTNQDGPIMARYNWWGLTSLSSRRFGNLSVIYQPIGADNCPVAPEAPCSLIVNGIDGLPVDTLYPVYDAEEFSDLDDEIAVANSYFNSGDYNNAETIYTNIIEEYPDSVQTFIAGRQLFTIKKIQNANQENFTALQNFYDTYASNVSDTLLVKMIENLITLCYIGKEEYETAISRLEDIIIQNPGEDEAIYAEIDAITAAMLANNSGGNLSKYSGKYSTTSLEDYSNKIDELVAKLGTSGSTTNEELVIPSEYNLYQNYPNPFNPVTTIKYDIVKAQDVTLLVYDILGRVVAILVNAQQQPGSYEVNWDASRFASGMYIYQLITDKYVNAKKMILLK